MKKFIVLTSVFALTGCFGSGAGVTSGNNDIIRAGTVNSFVTSDAAESNYGVTGIVSEIGVAEDGSTINIGNARSASPNVFQHKGKIYTSHRLDEVSFAMADEGFGGEMQFDINSDTGQITGFRLLPDDENHDGIPDDPEDEGMSFTREDEPGSAEFSGQVNTENGLQDAVLTYTSKGKNVGLKYSDFGYFDVDVIEGWRPVFIGGYDDVKKINTPDVANNLTFTGKAVGSVMARRTIGDVEYSDQEQLKLEGNARLQFNNGVSVLTTGFNNWYGNIVYTENINNNSKSIQFSQYHDTPLLTKDDNDDDVTLQNYYKYDNNALNNAMQFQEYDHGNLVNANHIESDIRYYGNTNTNRATEAVGLIQVRDCTGGICGGDVEADEVRMNLSFGVN